MSTRKPRRGRPPKVVSDATLTHRLQILLSDEDKTRLETLVELTHAESMGEAIRNAVRRDYERVTKQNQ